MEPNEARTRLLVSIDDEHRHDLEDVVERLRSVGMEVDRLMATLGTVTGSIATERLDALEAVEGVADVEPAREHQLSPPDSDVQ